MIMIYEIIIILQIIILTYISPFAAAQPQQYGCFGGNYTSNSTFSTNLNSLLPSLPPNITDSGFYNASSSSFSSSPNPDQAFASALCRGDAQLDTCRDCIRNATTELRTLCSSRRQGVIYKQTCTLRYSNESMYAVLSDSYLVRGNATTNISDPDQFKQNMRSLLGNLTAEAASGGPAVKVAAGSRNFSSSEAVFALVQCSPDLSPADCWSCLMGLAQSILQCCDGSTIVIMFVPSCNLQFQPELFYNLTRIQQVRAMYVPPSPSPSPSAPSPRPVEDSPPPGKSDNKTRTIIIVVVSMILCLVFGVCLFFWFRKRWKKKTQEITQSELDNCMEISKVEPLLHEFANIKAATNDFSDINKLGEGGFGVVYKGKLENGREIAVKRLSEKSGQGDEEFKNEVLSMAKLEHRNLVRLLGFSVQGTEKLLIYEYVENGSLHSFIFDPIKRVLIDWDQRYRIIKGIAKGLAYLHNDSGFCIIHRDLKAGNILLDKDMNPKIADFGMARFFLQDQSGSNTSRIVGTFGYMAPEYARHGQISVKLDVFSFGVLVLEIVSGQKNGSFRDSDNEEIEFMLSFAWENWREGNGKRMIDPVLKSGSSSVTRDMLRCIHIGLLCVQENAGDRPTIGTVLVMLSSLSLTLPVPSKPAFFMRGSAGARASRETSSMDAINESLGSTNEASITELYPR